MKAFALAIAAALAFASESAASETPNLRASVPDFVEEAGSEGCVRNAFGNCYKQGANEDGTPCCDGLECVYTNHRSMGSNNPANFVCKPSTSRQRSTDDSSSTPSGPCVKPGWANCYMQGAHEDGLPCCEGTTCKHFGGSGGSNNPANFVCVNDVDTEDHVALA